MGYTLSSIAWSSGTLILQERFVGVEEAMVYAVVQIIQDSGLVFFRLFWSWKDLTGALSWLHNIAWPRMADALSGFYHTYASRYG